LNARLLTLSLTTWGSLERLPAWKVEGSEGWPTTSRALLHIRGDAVVFALVNAGIAMIADALLALLVLELEKVGLGLSMHEFARCLHLLPRHAQRFDAGDALAKPMRELAMTRCQRWEP
jgi:hypothetical protein